MAAAAAHPTATASAFPRTQSANNPNHDQLGHATRSSNPGSLSEQLNPSYDLSQGKVYKARYVGSIGVCASMKQLNFSQRSALAKECIYQLCTAVNFITPDRKRKVDKTVARYLEANIKLEMPGRNIDFEVSTKGFNIYDMESRELLLSFLMPNISFASGGDQQTIDFVAFVAKNDHGNRSCHVIEFPGVAQDVITVIGEAFTQRFQAYMNREAPTIDRSDPAGLRAQPGQHVYYQDRFAQPERNAGTAASAANLLVPESPALIDFSSSPTPPINSCGTAFPLPPLPPANDALLKAAEFNEGMLRNEPYYHGPLPRTDAEKKMKIDGDYLVRRSTNDRVQFVLTGMQDGVVKHLLLIDDNGVVRTKDRRFDHVKHLIEYHRENKIPISSAESTICLWRPVEK